MNRSQEHSKKFLKVQFLDYVSNTYVYTFSVSVLKLYLRSTSVNEHFSGLSIHAARVACFVVCRFHIRDRCQILLPILSDLE